MSSGDTLLLTGVTREDQGMYQCVARRAEGETAQGTAELQLGGKVTPKLKINTMLFADGIWEAQCVARTVEAAGTAELQVGGILLYCEKVK